MSTKVKLVLVICSVFVAAIALGSNMGFKLNYPLVTNTASNNLNWVALPYFYQTNPTSQTICTDIGDSGGAGDCPINTATQVVWFDTANNAYATTYSCAGKNAFNLVPGRGYQVAVTAACTWKMVGSHDDTYDTTQGISFYANTAANNLNWIGIPYHTTAVDSAALCTQINAACSNIATQVVYFDTANNAYSTTYSCGGKNPFNLVPGMSYQVAVTAASAANCWHPAHY